MVLLMQENRSFDHYFGTLSGVRGFNDPRAQRLPDGKSVFYQPDPQNPAGYALPFRLDTHATNAQKIPSTSHACQVQHDSLNGGKMDNWLPAHRKADGKNGPYVMGYHTRADLPFQFALAESFTICDSYFCSVLGPTWPNRMMWRTGTVDPNSENGGPILQNTAPAGGYTWKTYAERLTEAGVSWKVYEQDDTYGCNMLENFAAFILSYDENDGLFDHVVPPIPPAGTPDEFVNGTSPGGTKGNGLWVGGGFRVPAIVISPWTAGGWVCSENFDHTSQLRFLERVTGVKVGNISDWRRRTFGDLTSAFRFNDGKAEAPALATCRGCRAGSSGRHPRPRWSRGSSPRR
ncbi:hypothetical protein GCM10017788_14670 [Amycolatopsis acidiphila]|nr:hypothetical protein GCM10017788_14670 [Amycolatopsis acidiphila]